MPTCTPALLGLLEHLLDGSELLLGLVPRLLLQLLQLAQLHPQTTAVALLLLCEGVRG